MDIPTVIPHALKPGDAIRIIAPAGPIDRREDFNKGVETLERLGFRVRWDERIFDASHYLAGGDEARAEEFIQAFEEPDVQAVLPLRGGYGSARLIPLLDERRLRSRCKIFMGFSDLTTLHLYLRRRFGWITFHGPMAASPSLGLLEKDQEAHLVSLWTDPGYRPRLSFQSLENWFPGTAEGILTGGCLSIVVASLGTPYEIRTEGRILFLEDLGEPPYRIDRMLTQLKLAGKFDGLAGIVLGSFEDCIPDKSGYSAEDVLRECLTALRVPLLAGFPAGHGRSNWAFPLGSAVRLDSLKRHVDFLEPAVRFKDE